MATDPREPQSLGEVLHRAREAGNAARIRPLIPEDWADRDPRLKALDEAMAAAVAAVVREQVRQLAIKHEATYRPEDPDLPDITGIPDLTKPGPDPLGDPFADLIGSEEEVDRG
jgi:hypothetical protein